MFCSDCQIELRSKRKPINCSDGKFRCKSCSHKRRMKKFWASERGKNWQQKYAKSEKGRAVRLQAVHRYLSTEKGKQKRKEYVKSERGKQVQREHCKRHYWSDPEYHRMKALSRIHGVEVDLLKQIKERDKICQRCLTDKNLTFDHIVPVSKGGKATLENLQILCNPCNASKGNR